MIDHKAALAHCEAKRSLAGADEIESTYLDLRRLVKEYFDAVDEFNALNHEQCSYSTGHKAEQVKHARYQALRAVIGEE